MDKSPSNLETSREFRTKTKKPKFLNLKLELNTSSHGNPITTKNKKTNPSKQSKTRGADTTPLKEKKREETVGGEKEEEQYDTVSAYLFNSATDSTLSSIHHLLPSSSSAVRLDCEDGETTEERWVSYSEVMSRSRTPRCCGGGDRSDGRSSMALKLDYEQVMEAWLDKGTLYVDGEPPQTVPDLHASADVFTCCGDAGSLWAVPEMETAERLWRGHREASLLRYKSKRQSRLFSKRIRYQVRKLNAEKRPRIKGRFVKTEERGVI